ncbi:hypothetical protein B0T18DRAFT_509 [Schizothecium vesticola]|uniref:Uncharacterized protein n=1 Tax=Schizothecium vesticola TaxID=314040 RepID=A0AA40KB73_9PEZI|nr:hypothetical protein B0T18DRAFT_509 [Schizothecium vesticola]
MRGRRGTASPALDTPAMTGVNPHPAAVCGAALPLSSIVARLHVLLGHAAGRPPMAASEALQRASHHLSGARHPPTSPYKVSRFPTCPGRPPIPSSGHGQRGTVSRCPSPLSPGRTTQWALIPSARRSRFAGLP